MNQVPSRVQCCLKPKLQRRKPSSGRSMAHTRNSCALQTMFYGFCREIRTTGQTLASSPILLNLKISKFWWWGGQKRALLQFRIFSKQKLHRQIRFVRDDIHVKITLQCIGKLFLLLFVESGTRKLRKVVESRTKFLFDVKRVLDSTTMLVLDSSSQYCCNNDTFAAAL